MTDFESMTIDELVAFKAERKSKVESLKDEMRAAHKVYARKVEAERIQDRIKAAGLDGKVVVIDTAELKAEGK
jgi:hypothetical protein